MDVAELCAPFTHQERIVRNELGLADDVEVNPSGGPLAANPIMAAGLLRLGEVANRIMAGEAGRGVAHATSGHLLQQNLVAVLEGDCMSKNRVAVVGIGQTKYTAVRGDVSLPGLLREAAYRALEDAQLTMDDIDAVVVGKAPDFFEGIMMPETYLAEALGRGGQAPVPGAHRRLGRRLHGHRGRQPRRGRGARAGAHHRLAAAVGLRGHVGVCRSPSPSSSSWWPGPAATSHRSSASTCGVRAPRTTSASWWP